MTSRRNFGILSFERGIEAGHSCNDLYPAVAKLERATLPLWRRLAALRVFLVFEKFSLP
jgi:hypothetical protein